MKLKQTRCPNCNASVKVKNTNEDITCEFCGSHFSYVPSKEEVEFNKAEAERAKNSAEEYKAKKEYEDSKTINEMSSPVKKIFIIVFIFIFAIGILILLFNFFLISSTAKEGLKQNNSEQVDKNTFNMNYEYLYNVSGGFFVKKALGDIINSNKKYKDHIIKVTYKDVTTTKEEDIEKIMDEIDEYIEYRVTLNYDDAGYVNEFIVKDV